MEKRLTVGGSPHGPGPPGRWKGTGRPAISRQDAVLISLAAFLLFPWITSGAASSRLQRDPLTPGKGVFLVAKPAMEDPRFRRSVILLVEHEEEGSLGFIVNRATGVPLSRVLPEFESPGGESPQLFFGGPVQMNSLMFLTRSDEPLEGASPVMEDVYFGGDRQLLERLLSQPADPTRLRLYAGYSGWGPGQLAAEISRGDWNLVPADARMVFETEMDGIWRDLVEPSGPQDRFIVHGLPGSKPKWKLPSPGCDASGAGSRPS